MVLFGAADVPLVPPEPLPLGGYTERRSALAQPGGDTLYARARAIGDGVVVVVELLTVPESLVDEVRARTREKNVWLVATHTHCAPDSQMLNDRMTLFIPGIASFRRQWLNWYADQIASAVFKARENQNLQVSAVSTQQASVPLARARRPLAAPDQRALRVSLRVKDQWIVLFDLFAAHPTLFGAKELQTRGDWPGQLMARTQGLAMTGAIGDLSPVPPLPLTASSVGQSQAFARLLDAALSQATRRVHPLNGVDWTSEAVALPSAVPHPQFANANGIPDSLASTVVTRFAPLRASVWGFRIGPALMIGVPGEPTQSLARLMTQGDPHRWVVSHVNGWAGYLLTRDDYNRGGYEAQLGFYGPNAGSAFVEAARRL